jgi:cell fate regulator YaaT (PSP1 superfamily)
MTKYLVSVYNWESPRLFEGEEGFQKGVEVVVALESGMNIGRITEVNVDSGEEAVQRILRLATKRDLEIFAENEEKKKEIIQTSKNEAGRLGLEMKIIDAQISLDGSNAVIIFTADGRIDFRELVKNLARIFHRSIKMYQIGSRDEARKIGGCGVCGRKLCCLMFPGSLPSISTEMARVQQVAHRGSERISGLCGRLLCCLSYEAEQYRKMLQGMPEVRSFVKTKRGKGEVLELNVMQQEIKLRLEDGSIVIIKKEEL